MRHAVFLAPWALIEAKDIHIFFATHNGLGESGDFLSTQPHVMQLMKTASGMLLFPHWVLKVPLPGRTVLWLT